MNRTFTLFFIVFLITWFFTLNALEPSKRISQYKHDAWRTGRGLNQKSVITLCQTSDGYIWLGTLNGLVRFDGHRFKTFNSKNTPELMDDCINVLLQDPQGVLWIGTGAGGLSCLRKGKFSNLSIQDHPSLKNIRALYYDRNGTLWVGSKGSGLSSLKDNRLKTYGSVNGITDQKIRALNEDQNGKLWIGTSKGLYIQQSPGKFKRYEGPDGAFNHSVLSIFPIEPGNIWVGCLDGLFRLESKRVVHYDESDGLPNPKVLCIYKDTGGNLWAGTDGGGLIRIVNDKIESYSQHPTLSTASIYTIHEDREQNLWLGSYDEGLNCLQDTFFLPFTTIEGLSSNNVNCIAQSSGGKILIGTQSGVDLISDGQITRMLTTENGLPGNFITALLEDGKHNLWVGTQKGLVSYKNGKPTSHHFEGGKRYNYIMELRLDKEGAVWVLTKEDLKRFHNGNFTRIIKRNELSNAYLMCFYLDREGTPWIGTNNGQGLFFKKSGKLRNISTRNGLVHNDVESIYQDRNGILYIGTRGGLSLINGSDIVNYKAMHGLTENYIYHILEDQFGFLWLNGATGISRIKKSQLVNFSLTKRPGLSPVHYNESSGLNAMRSDFALQTKDGCLWFATGKGIAIIDPKQIKSNESPPPVVIEEFSIDGEPANYLSQQSGKDNPLPIPSGIKRIAFSYSAPSYIKSDQIKFQLKLDGFDDSWIFMGTKRNTNYTGLSPGQYTFKVKSCNSDGVWSITPASVSFYLKPSFWQSPWFYINAVIFVLLSSFFLYRRRINRLKLRQKELADLVKSRTIEVEDKNLQLQDQSEKLKEMDIIKSRFFANISHEFRTPLTLLMGPLEHMIHQCPDNETDKKHKFTMMLRNGQRLLRLINQLLELSKLDSGKMKLQAVKTPINSFIKGIADSFRFMAQQKELDFSYQCLPKGYKEENLYLYIDPRKMEDLMSNLLINALKFTPPGGQVRVTVTAAGMSTNHFPGGEVEISVQDTGPGIPKDKQKHIFDRFYQAESSYETSEKGSGIGLALSKELVQLHRGTIEVNSIQAEGTSFIIRLPMGKEHLSDTEIAQPGFFHNGTGTAMDTFIDQSPTQETENTEINLNLHEPDKEIILVVEDSADMCQYIKAALEPVYTVMEAVDGKDGMEKAKNIIPDLIVSDIMMPHMDGYELCKTLKSDRQTSHIPVILLTAKASEEHIVAGLETGADDYITKPFSMTIMSARIKNLIDLRRHMQQNIHREMALQPINTKVSTIDREFLVDLQMVLKEYTSDPEFNVEQLCKRLYMSNTTLYRKIGALCGQTPTEFIRAYRLKRAAELLKSGSGSVTEVAFEVGFSSRAYFTKCFKQKFHTLPSNYTSSG